MKRAPVFLFPTRTTQLGTPKSCFRDLVIFFYNQMESDVYLISPKGTGLGMEHQPQVRLLKLEGRKHA